ncbi:MAG: metallophosphoesterase [Victivallales bacterium]|nr:metallophosphoesterase [Victivallales bacterium]
MSFILFIAAVIGLNVYDWWKLKRAFLQGQPIGAAVLLVFILLLLMGPAWMRPIFSRGNQPRFLVQACWIWLAWSFWMFVALIVCDLWNLVFLLCQMTFKQSIPVQWMLGPQGCVWVALGFVAFGTLWGLVEANAIRLRTVEIASVKVPESADGFKLVLLSDIHLGPAATQRKLKKVIRMVEEASPDLVLSAGDLIDGSQERELKMAECLAELAPPYGKIAVYGNHDVYSGLDFSRKCHEAAGFKLLENQSAQPVDWLWIYGEKDPASGWHPGYKGEKTVDVEKGPEGAFCVLLKHRPDVSKQGQGTDGVTPSPLPDLQLSGHSHGGQIFPFNYLVRLQYKYREGRLHKLQGGMRLYVSPGTGVWGPPFRLFARPEITLFVFKKE